MMRLTDTCRVEREDIPGDFTREEPGITVVIPKVATKIVPASGTETLSGEQIEYTHSHTIWMRFDRRVDETCRLVGPLGPLEEVYDIKAKTLVRNRANFWKLDCVQHK